MRGCKGWLLLFALIFCLALPAAWAGEKIIFSYKADGVENYGIYTMGPGYTDEQTALLELPEVDAWCPRVSPDGKKVAFIDRKTAKIWLANMDGTDAHILETPVGAKSLAWSSDGNNIYFWATATSESDLEQFYSVPAAGGDASLLWGGQGYWAWFMDGGFGVQGVTNSDTGEVTDYILLGATTAVFEKCNLLRIKVRTDPQEAETVFSGLGDIYTPVAGPVDGRLIFQADDDRAGSHAVYMMQDDGSASQMTDLYSGSPWWNSEQRWFVFIHADQSTYGQYAYQGRMYLKEVFEGGRLLEQTTSGTAACPQVYTEAEDQEG